MLSTIKIDWKNGTTHIVTDTRENRRAMYRELKETLADEKISRSGNYSDYSGGSVNCETVLNYVRNGDHY